MNLATLADRNLDALTGVIDKEFFTGTVTLTHDHIEFGGPLTIGLAEPAVLEAVRRCGFVFLPKQLQGDAFAPQFSVHL